VHQQSRYIPTLDGWRALAVIGVILYHGRQGFFSGSPTLMRIAAHGGIGVDIFFALSGFLICGLLLDEFARTGDLSLRRFYIRRCFRILPPYFAALAGICAASLFASVSLNRSDLVSCLLFYRNYLPLGMDQQGGFYTAHFWTLAVEEHFYLIWPMLLLLAKPKRAGRVAFTLAMLVFGWRELQPHLHMLGNVFPAANVNARTDTRIDALLWGCLAAIYFPAIKRTFERIRFSQLWVPFLALVIAMEAKHVPGLKLWQAILLPALLLSTVIQPSSLLSRVLEWQPLRWIGSLSYSLYLWQELFLPELHSVAAPGVFHNLQRWPWNVLAIMLCAVASRYLLELPMVRFGHRMAASAPRLGGRVPTAAAAS
jgi:peptidoglycan/LPS O-acetylase OafA/YrhL